VLVRQVLNTSLTLGWPDLGRVGRRESDRKLACCTHLLLRGKDLLALQALNAQPSVKKRSGGAGR